jgi:hypothetical protein
MKGVCQLCLISAIPFLFVVEFLSMSFMKREIMSREIKILQHADISCIKLANCKINSLTKIYGMKLKVKKQYISLEPFKDQYLLLLPVQCITT